jgi:transcriptional regulator with XRE-family HTH domain
MPTVRPNRPKSREAVALGEAIRSRRDTAKLNQRELASRAGIDPTDLSRIENGRREPTLAQLRAIARALRIAPGRLVEAASHSS